MQLSIFSFYTFSRLALLKDTKSSQLHLVTGKIWSNFAGIQTRVSFQTNNLSRKYFHLTTTSLWKLVYVVLAPLPNPCTSMKLGIPSVSPLSIFKKKKSPQANNKWWTTEHNHDYLRPFYPCFDFCFRRLKLCCTVMCKNCFWSPVHTTLD